VQVVSDDGRTVADVVTSDEGWTVATCRECREEITDRGHFEDTVRAAENHVDQH
jgi:hypothetical protein